MKKLSLLPSLFLALSLSLSASLPITIPPFDDTYSSYVQKLENEDFNIDFKDFRFSFIDSKQYLVANEKFALRDSLMEALYSELQKNNHEAIINITCQLLSIDYTDLSVHNIRRLSFELTGNSAQAKKHETILLGLLGSIITNGDGETCQTAWPIIQLAEAYFIIQMGGGEILPNADVSEENECEQFLVKGKDKTSTIFFNVEKMQEGYRKIE